MPNFWAAHYTRFFESYPFYNYHNLSKCIWSRMKSNTISWNHYLLRHLLFISLQGKQSQSLNQSSFSIFKSLLYFFVFLSFSLYKGSIEKPSTQSAGLWALNANMLIDPSDKPKLITIYHFYHSLSDWHLLGSTLWYAIQWLNLACAVT